MAVGFAIYTGGPNGWAYAAIAKNKNTIIEKHKTFFIKGKNYKTNKNLVLYEMRNLRKIH